MKRRLREEARRRGVKGPSRGPEAPAPASAPPRWLPNVLRAALLAVIAVIVVRLGQQAAGGVFASDECFHAYASEWILEQRRLPEVLPQFYSGFLYYYPPLLHVIGGVWAGVLGLNALHWLPIALHAALALVLVTGAFGTVPGRAGTWAAVLVLATPTISSMAVRLYVEGLTTLLFACTVALLFGLCRKPGVWRALALGSLIGLSILAKLSGWQLLVLCALAACAYAVRHRARPATHLAISCAAGLAIALPWLVRNHLLFGSALYPAFAPDLDPGLYEINRAKFSTPPPEFLAAVPRILGPWISICMLAALVIAWRRRRWTLREGVILWAIGGLAATAFVPMAQARHLNPLLAAAAFAAAAAIFEAIGNRHRLALGIDVALLAIGLHAAWTLPNWRAPADLPGMLREGFPEVKASTPPDATILSLWTYDTFYYTRRNATWPIPWGQRERPLSMFHDADPDSCLAHLRQFGVDYALVPTTARAGRFDSANYPDSFLQMLVALMRRGDARLAWSSPTLALIQFPPADSLQADPTGMRAPVAVPPPPPGPQATR